MEIVDYKNFFNDEVRCGYHVSSKMKHVWAIQLEMLRELDRVCEKYGLTYYADSGTLIGAIRHKGYIPWDDDIDLVMFREDYEKLLKVAKTEFKAPLFLQSVYSEKKYVRGLAKLRNSSTTAIYKNDLNTQFNRGIFIDIFPLDSVPDNDVVLKIWCWKIKVIRSLLRNWAYYEPSMKKGIFESFVRQILQSLVDKIGYQKIYDYFIKTCSRYNRKNTKRVSYVAYSYGKKKHVWRKELFKNSHKVPFEFMSINIPDGYDERLRVEYGDYMVMKNIPATHGEMILEPDIPYTEYLMSHNPEEEIAELIRKNHDIEHSFNTTNRFNYRVVEKPDWISYDMIAEVLHDAHKSNVEKGMRFVASFQDGRETERRLGECGKFFVALTDEDEIAGVGAVSLHDSCTGWYGKKQPYSEIKMVGVPEKYKGLGISSALYRKMEEFGFSVNELMIMNTARDNHIVLDSNARHGWTYVDYKSWPRTDYYSPVMAKWKNGCPYSLKFCRLMFNYRRLYTILVRRKNGQQRLLFRLLKNESKRKNN